MTARLFNNSTKVHYYPIANESWNYTQMKFKFNNDTRHSQWNEPNNRWTEKERKKKRCFFSVRNCHAVGHLISSRRHGLSSITNYRQIFGSIFAGCTHTHTHTVSVCFVLRNRCMLRARRSADDAAFNSFQPSSLSTSISVRFSLDVLNQLASCQN